MDEAGHARVSAELLGAKECESCEVGPRHVHLSPQLAKELLLYDDYRLNRRVMELAVSFVAAGSVGAAAFLLGRRRARSVFVIAGAASLFGAYHQCALKMMDLHGMERWARGLREAGRDGAVLGRWKAGERSSLTTQVLHAPVAPLHAPVAPSPAPTSPATLPPRTEVAAQSPPAVPKPFFTAPARTPARPAAPQPQVIVPKPRFQWFGLLRPSPSADYDLSFNKNDFTPADFRAFHAYLLRYFPSLAKH